MKVYTHRLSNIPVTQEVMEAIHEAAARDEMAVNEWIRWAIVLALK